MEKARGSTAKISPRIVKKTGNSSVTNNILPFSLMFHRAERLLYFDILGVISNEFEDNFVFASNFPGKLSLFCIK